MIFKKSIGSKNNKQRKLNKNSMKNITNLQEQDLIKQGISQVIEKNKSGEINLDELLKFAKDILRVDLVQAVRSYGKGTLFIAGRRGGKSRLVYGDKVKEYSKPVYTRQTVKTQVAPINENKPHFHLQLSFQGKTIATVELEEKLIAA